LLKWTVLGAGTIGPDGTLGLVEPPGTPSYPYYVASEVAALSINPTLQISPLATGGVTLSATGQVDHAYAVLTNCNLAAPVWSALGTIYSDSTGRLSFTDTAPTSPRFYRLQDLGYAPPPPSLQIAPSPDGTMVLTGTGQANRTYNILASQDFVSWENLQTQGVTSDAAGAFNFTDYDAPNHSFRVYRAAEIPAGYLYPPP
jgi:hypothetical protein